MLSDRPAKACSCRSVNGLHRMAMSRRCAGLTPVMPACWRRPSNAIAFPACDCCRLVSPIASTWHNIPPGRCGSTRSRSLVDIEVRPSNSDVRSVSIAPQFDERKLRVEVADDSRPFLPGRPVSLPVDAQRVARLRLQIKMAAELVEDVEGGQYPIQLTITAGVLRRTLHRPVCRAETE